MEDEQSILSYIEDLNKSFNDIKEHPVNINPSDVPSNFQILMQGISSSKNLDFLFSSKVDTMLEKFFNQLTSGNIEGFLENKDKIKMLADNIFGEGSFEGPVSREVIGSIQATMMSKKYMFMKDYISRSLTALRKMHMIIRNLEKDKKRLKGNKEQLEKYKEAVYAIKNLMKLAVKIYKHRELVNRKVYNGLKNIIHEEEIIETK